MAEMDVTARFRADISDMQRKMDDLNGMWQDAEGKWRDASGKFASDAQKAAAGIDTVGASARGVEGHTSRMGSALKTVGGIAAGAFAIGGAAAVAFGVKAIGAAEESQKSVARLDQIASSMGLLKGELGGSTQRLQDFAGQLSKNIGVEDEAIMGAQSLLLTFKNVAKTAGDTGGMFDRATTAAADLAAAGFGSLDGNAKQLGKALQDPVKGMSALSRSGVTFTAAQKEQVAAMMKANDVAGAQEVVMKAVEQQVGGTAAAVATDSDKMKVAFGELQETVGKALFPVIESLAKTLTPVIEQLQGPLGAVAETIGGALAQAFEALAPLLPVIVGAFSNIAGAVIPALAGAISSLLPAVIPIVQMFAEFAGKIGPMLAPVLSMIAGLIGQLLEAVAPLLPPLMDLVFTILQAAMPILDVVAQAFSSLVSALSPVVDAVAMLLPPIGQLVDMALAAIMPIITPLLPVIEALANVLSTILVKAIALLMQGIGYMIIGFSKIAPFILNNVTKPVVTAFLTMAENVVGAAASAFGWVPGLGDKLNTAKSAISDFKTNAQKGIESASKTISTEGEKIGRGLIDNGVKMWEDPTPVKKSANTFGSNAVSAISSQTPEMKQAAVVAGAAMPIGLADGMKDTTKVKTAASNATVAATTAVTTEVTTQAPKVKDKAQKVGEALGDGVKAGIDAARPSIMAKARQLGRDAADAMAVGAETHSPSKLTTQTGKDLADGIKAGLDANRGKAVAAALDLGHAAGEAIDKALNDKTDSILENFKNKVAKLGEIAQGWKEWSKEITAPKLEAGTADEWTYLTTQLGMTEMAMFSFKKSLPGKEVTQKTVEAFGELSSTLQDQLSTALDTARTNLANATQAFDEFAGSVADSLTQSINFSDAWTAGNETGEGFMAALQEQSKKAVEFADNVKKLIAAGLSQDALQQVLSAGVAAGNEIAKSLLAGGSGTIDQANSLVASAQAAASEVGQLAATQYYQAGVDNATQQVNGIMAQIQTMTPLIMEVMDKLAKKMRREVIIDVKVSQNDFNVDVWVTRHITEQVTRVVSEISGARAAGGPVDVGKAYLVGEKGPELFVANRDGYIIPNGGGINDYVKAGMMSMGNVPVGGGSISNTAVSNYYSIVVQAGVGDPREIGRMAVEAISRFERANGPVFARV